MKKDQRYSLRFLVLWRPVFFKHEDFALLLRQGAHLRGPSGEDRRLAPLGFFGPQQGQKQNP